MLHNNSIFGQLQSTIANSMNLSIYSISKISGTNTLNVSLENHNGVTSTLNNFIICDDFICGDDDNNNICN